MVINALNSGAKVFMADFEDATSPVWDELVQGQINLRNRWLGRLRLHRSRQRQALCDRRQSRRADGPPARLAPRRAACDGRRRADRRRLFDFGLYLWHNARAALDAGFGPLFLSAQARKPARSGAVERRVRLRRGTARAGARNDQGDGADRDASRRVRDGRDPLRAAKTISSASTAAAGTIFSATSSGSAARPTG